MSMTFVNKSIKSAYNKRLTFVNKLIKSAYDKSHVKEL